MKLKTTCALITLALAAVAAHAQTQTLKEVTQQAIVSNPEVLARWHAFEAANHERSAGAGGYLPRLDLTAGAGRDDLNDPLKTSDLSRHSSSLTLTQTLFDGALVYNDVARLDHQRMARLYELRDTSETVVLDVVRTYADVLRYRRLVELAEENYIRHRAVFMQIQKKTQAGVSRRVDLEQIAGRLALAESNLLQETANLHDVTARFQRLVGVVPANTLEPMTALTAAMPQSPNAALGSALKTHPALLAAVESVRANDKVSNIRKASYAPRVDLRLRSDRGGNLSGITGRTSNEAVEIQMSWNLFNGFSDISRVRQQADLINVSRDQRDKACRDVRQTLLIAYNDTVKLSEQLGYLDQHQLSIEKARDAYRKQFDIGQRSLLDLLDSENELFQSKRAYANAEYDRYFAFARTHAGMGMLHQALGLSRQEPGELPDLGKQDDKEDEVQNCPAEAAPVYLIDKAKLNERAKEYIFESPTPTPAPDAAPPGQPVALPPKAK
ncbi:MAG TPA: TolC family outer membrane protein [Telluria sp.]|jgi:adhesin transport system outer membrane protein